MFLVCGEALYDVFLGEEQPDGGLRLEACAGGSPFNVAIGLARLGTPVGFLGAVSLDMLGERLFQRLQREGVDTRFVVRRGAPTTLSLVGQTPAGTPAYSFLGAGAADRSLTASELPEREGEIDGLHLGSYSIVARPSADALAVLAERAAGKQLISLDPNVRPAIEPDLAEWRRRVSHLAGIADVIKASHEDLELLWPGKSMGEVAKRWLDQGAGLAVVTQGKHGAIAYSREHAVTSSAARAEVVDTVGAGDAFQAALLHGLLRARLTTNADLAGISRAKMAELLGFANRAAAIACGRRGADLPRAEDLGSSPATTTDQGTRRA